MKRLISLILAMAMIFSIAMPNLALAYENSTADSSSSLTSEESANEGDSSAVGEDNCESEQETSPTEANPEDAEDSESLGDESEGEESVSTDEESKTEKNKNQNKETPTQKKDSQKTLETTLKCVDGAKYTFVITYDKAAEIPDNAKLSVVELNEALSKEDLKKSKNKDRPFDTEIFIEKEALEQEQFDLWQGLKVRDTDYILFTKFLDLKLTADGKAIQPKTPVEVALKTDVVDEGASNALEVAVYDKKATRKWKEKLRKNRVNSNGGKRYPEKVYTTIEARNETKKDKGVKIEFQLKKFTRIGVAGVAKQLKSWDVHGETLCVYGPRNLKVKVAKESQKSPKAGLEKVHAFSVKPNEKKNPDYKVTFWLGSEQKPYEQTESELKVMSADEAGSESGIVVSKLKNGKAKKELIGTQGTATPVAVKQDEAVGVLWDTGLRSQSVESDDVSVKGMLPKKARITADDMLWRYSRPQLLQKSVGDEAETLAAYNITITGKNGDFQPDDGESVSVAITNDAICESKRMEIWHLKDDGSVEVITDFTVEGNTISFDASSFSVYMVVQITKEQILTASDGDQYKVTVTYDSDAGIPEDAELRVNELAAKGKKYQKYIKKAAKKLNRKPEQFAYAHAFDIALVNQETGKRYQPNDSVTVSVKLLSESVKQGDSMSVIHFGKQTEELSSRIVGDWVEFETDGFSLFVVSKDALLQHFAFYSQDDYGSPVICSEQVLANGEKLEKPADPTTGGAVFDHWSHTKGTDTPVIDADTFKPITIDPNQIDGDTDKAKQDWLDDEANWVKFYAVFKSSKVAITCYNQSGQVFRRALIDKDGSLDFNTSEYNYKPIQNKDGIVLSFAGWVDNPQGVGTPVNNSTPFNVDTDLYPKLTEGHYLHFDSRLDSASAIESLIVPVDSYNTANESANAVVAQLNGRTEPVIPVAAGYIFTGWYIQPSDKNDFDASNATRPVFKLDSDGVLSVDIDEYTKLLNPSHNLPNSPTLYAHWVKEQESAGSDHGDPAPTPTVPTTAPYNIQIWAQNAENETSYDFVRSINATGTIGAKAPVTVNGVDYTRYGTTLGSDFNVSGKAVHTAPTVQADGSTVVNIYYERRSISIKFMCRDIYADEAGETGIQYGLVDGDYVELTKVSVPANSELSSTGVYSYSYDIYTAVDTNESGEYYYYDEQEGRYCSGYFTYVSADSVWKEADSDYICPTVYNKTSEVRRCTDLRYKKRTAGLYAGTFVETETDGSERYGLDDNQNLAQLNVSHWTYEDNGTKKDYTGKRYKLKNTSGWTEWKTVAGLCGQTIAQKDADWSETLKYDWYDGVDGNNEVVGEPIQGFGSFESNHTYYGTKQSSTARTVTFYKQRADSNEYQKAERFTVADGTFRINNSEFSGFKAVEYKADSGNWTEWTESVDTISFSRTLAVRYNRKLYKLTFDERYQNDQNQEVKNVVSVRYGAKPSSLDEHKKLPVPVREGWHFDGWYMDSALHKRVTVVDYADFVMPNKNITFYAKWTAVQYQVRLVPNGGELKNQSPLLYVSKGNNVTLPQNITRKYVDVGKGKGEYNYDAFNGSYELAGEVTDETRYISKSGAFRFECWAKATPIDGSTPQIIEYSNGKFAYAYGDYVRTGDGEGSYTYTEDDGYRLVDDGMGNYDFIYAKLKMDGTDYATTNFTSEGINDAIVLVAQWKTEDTFRVKYDVRDPSYPGLNYQDVTEPVDKNEYVDGSSARVLPAVTAPDGYTLDYWFIQGDHTNTSYQSNEIVKLSSTNAQLGSDGIMWVTIVAHYRPYKTTERDIAEFQFMAPKSANTYVFGTDDYEEYSLYDKQKISKNETLAMPATPPAPGDDYVFRGWFYDKKGVYPFRDFSPTNPTCTILYALFERSVSVNFYLTSSVGNRYSATSKVLATRTFPIGEKMDTLGVNHPVDADHYVDKWIAGLDNWNTYQINPSAVDISYVFDYKSTSNNNVPNESENRKLYAVLKERKYVLFDAQGGSYVDNRELPESGIPDRPTDPVKDGFLFVGWYTQAVAGGEQYCFDKRLDTANYPTYDGTLYARWDADTDAQGTLHVIFWAQTADHPDDDATDTKHYQILHSVDLTKCVPYGKHERDEAFLKSQLSDFLGSDGEYDIVRTVIKAQKDKTNNGAVNAFVNDALDYKGNNANIIANWKASDHINELSKYFELSTKHEEPVDVDSSGQKVLNIRFDLKTFYLQFDPQSKAEIHLGSTTYPEDGSTKYEIPIWLNRPIADLWPSSEEGDTHGTNAYCIWKDSSTKFYGWQMSKEKVYPTNSSALTTTSNKLHRTPLNMADKLIVDTVIENGGDGKKKVLSVTPTSEPANNLKRTAMVHYLVRVGDTTEFRELEEMKTELPVEELPTSKLFYPPHFTPSEQEPITRKLPANFVTSSRGGSVYRGFYESVCKLAGHGGKHAGVKYAYLLLEPASLSGYTILENEYAHRGDLKTPDNEWDDGTEDSKNVSPLYNLVMNRVARAHAIFDKDDPTYLAYFADHQTQYVDENDSNNKPYYNFYYYFKPENFTINLYTDSSTPFKTGLKSYFGQNLMSEVLNDVGQPEVPAAYSDGYRFAGWATSPFQSDRNAAIADDFTMPAYNLTLYAIWEPVTYKVTTWGVDAHGLATDTDLSATYTGKHGQRIRELKIPNPQKANSLFKCWKKKENESYRVTGMFSLVSDVTIVPEWDSLEIRHITYVNKRASDTELQPHGEVPTDENEYIEGAQAIIKDGKGLSVPRVNIDGETYSAAFTCWEDEDGNRYYPNDSYTIKGEDLTLYAVYSAYREARLIYHAGANGKFVVTSDGHDYPADKIASDGTIVVSFRDWLRDDFNYDDGDRIPNDRFVIAQDQNGTDFTVELNDGSGAMVLAGWSYEEGGSVAACSGDKGYLNTMETSSIHLWPVWGICKVVDLDKKEHVFRTIQDAVNFIQNNGMVNGKNVGRIANETGKIEMLIDNYNLKDGQDKQVNIPAGVTVTLATAGKLGTAPNGEHLFFTGTGDRAKIIRDSGNNDDSLFKVESGGSFTTEKIILDGGATMNPDSKWNNTDWGCTGAVSVSGGIINSDGSVTVGANSTLQNSAVKNTDHNGGAVYVSATGDFDIQGEITHCISTGGNGGGVYVDHAVNLNETASATDLRASVSYCKSGYSLRTSPGDNPGFGGGGVYIGTGPSVTVRNIDFHHCMADGAGDNDGGAGLYVAAVVFDVENCDFKNNESRQKNAAGLFHFNKNAKSKTTVSHCIFENCKATGNSGGAMEAGTQDVHIRYSTFTNCESKANGGAINVWNTKATIEVSNCSFENCKAKQNLGGGVRNHGKTTTITDCTFKNCYAKKSGGGVCSDTSGGSLTISGALTNFEECKSDTSGGGIYLEGNANSKLNFSDGTIHSCTAPNGGGVYQSNGTFTFTSGSISSCVATSASGGGVYLGKGTFKMQQGESSIVGCMAKTSGGGVYLGGAEKDTSSFTLSSGSIANCCAPSGGGVYIAHKNATMTINKNGDAITGCEARTVEIVNGVASATELPKSGNQGGGIYLAGGTLGITGDNAAIYGCKAGEGGGIYLGNGTFTFSKGIIGSLTAGAGNAAHNGGGIYQGGGTLTIGTPNAGNDSGGRVQGNVATPTSLDSNDGNGGGIYLGGGSFTLYSGGIGVYSDDQSDTNGGNRAKQGGGLFVADNARASIFGGVVFGNHASELGAGIAVGGLQSKLYFAGEIQVWNNKLDSKEQCDVCLNFDSCKIINTAAPGIKPKSHIGVYVTDEPKDASGHKLHDKHGIGGTPFGTFKQDDTEYDNNLNRFINNRSGTRYDGYEYYYGVRKADAPDDDQIYWVEYICMITDTNDNMLYTNDKGTAPALYQYLGHHGAFEALGNLEGDEAFYYRDKVRRNKFWKYNSNDYKVKMLVGNYSLRWTNTVEVPGNINITLTIAEGEDFYEANNPGYCIISRGRCKESMFTTEAGSTLIVTNAVIDGGAVFDESGNCTQGQVGIDGALIKSGGNVTLGSNAMLQNSVVVKQNNKDHYGAAVEFNGSGTFTMNDGSKIEHCYATDNAAGGAVLYVDAGNDDTVSFDAPSKEGQISKCEATNGLVYVQSGTLNLTGTFRAGKTSVAGDSESTSATPTVNVKDCKSKFGGFVYTNGGTLNLNGTVSNFKTAYISNGEVKHDGSGGAAYINGGTLHLNGTIDQCTARQGGGVYAKGSTVKLEQSSSKITNCTAEFDKDRDANGGAIYATGDAVKTATVIISAGEVSGNIAKGFGGGAIRIENGSSVTVSGTALIQNNRLERISGNQGFGGAVGIKRGTLTVNGGTFRNNTVKTSGREAYGGAIHVSGTNASNANNGTLDEGTLTITGGKFIGNTATAQNGTVYGGAISIQGQRAKANISGGTFSGNKATTNNKDAFGGAIAVVENGELTMTGGTLVCNCVKTGDASRKTHGAGIYLGYDVSKDYGTLKLSGSPNFGGTGTYSVGEGEAMEEYLLALEATEVKKAAASGSGTVTKTIYRRCYKGSDGTIQYPDANVYYLWEDGLLYTANASADKAALVTANVIPGIGNLIGSVNASSELKNGVQDYIQTREDVFIDGFQSSNASSLVITGKLTNSDGNLMTHGSIWVGAAQSRHYMQNMQFARFGGDAVTGNVVKLDAVEETSAQYAEAAMHAFRNAYDNGKTANTTDDFLCGEAGNGLYVNWAGINGTAWVMLKKIGSAHEPLSGAVFELYKNDTQMEWPEVVDAEGHPVTSLSSDSSGVLWIGNLSFGEYYLKEIDTPHGYSGNKNKWFCLIVDETGVWISEQGYTDKAEAKTDAEAVFAAAAE